MLSIALGPSSLNNGSIYDQPFSALTVFLFSLYSVYVSISFKYTFLLNNFYWQYLWDGKIDDIRIYNRAPSETEIQSLYTE